MNVEKIMAELERKNPGEAEYLQAVHEVLESIQDLVNENPKYEEAGIIERIVEPDRVLSFRVAWVDDSGKVQVNRGYRVQYNNAIGPYKGGIRFHPSVNLSILKFLGFEQIFKNSLTSLPMGGAKGGADFDATGKSPNEIMRFCQAYMLELWKIIGPETDVPAGDIGVGAREVGYMYGMYKKLAGEHTGVFTGKGLNWGGSLIRPEATGFGAVYFAQEMVKAQGQTLNGKTVCISGFGQVAWGAVSKANQLGAKVVTISGPDGYIYDADGISGEKIEYMTKLRATNQNIVAPYAKEFPNAKFIPNKRPWEVKCDLAMPCATQNELGKEDAENLVKNGCTFVAEGANMPSTPEAIAVFQKAKINFAPGKAVNAGGVSTSGFEMTQNSMKLSWTKEEVEERLQQTMINIHAACVKHGTEADGYVNYVKGANIAGFVKVANTMIDLGVL